MPLMSDAQTTAFNSANTEAGSAANVYSLTAGMFVVIAFLWFAWVCVSAYRSLNSGVRTQDASTKIVRALFVFILMLALAAV